MNKYQFSLVLGPLSQANHEVEDALYEAGCDDSLLSFYAGTAVLDFTRAGNSYAKAVISAIKNVERANIGAVVVRVGPDDLVNAAEIAGRASVSREAVRLWIQGKRGQGDFPPSVARVGKSSVWSWLDVSEWLFGREQIEKAVVESARFIAAVNLFLNQKRSRALASKLKFIESKLGGKPSTSSSTMAAN